MAKVGALWTAIIAVTALQVEPSAAQYVHPLEELKASQSARTEHGKLEKERLAEQQRVEREKARTPSSSGTTAGSVGETRAVHLEAKAKAGEETRLGAFADLKPDCTPWGAPEIRTTEPPQHGSTTVRTGTQPVRTNPKCGTRTAPVSFLFYRPDAGYVGQDRLSVLVVTKDDAPQPVTIAVSVADR